PCRHGPPASQWLVGHVIGFALRWEGQQHGVLWISGDTVFFQDIRDVAERLTVGTALLHMGGVGFPLTGPLRYTMTAQDAIRVCELVRPRVAIPIHYEGWSHFQESQAVAERSFAGSPIEVRDRIRWITPGVPATIST
ncbi:MAG: MBL fold metallo-hydrolase, partial [Gemmatimonas sp.]